VRVIVKKGLAGDVGHDFAVNANHTCSIFHVFVEGLDFAEIIASWDISCYVAGQRLTFLGTRGQNLDKLMTRISMTTL